MHNVWEILTAIGTLLSGPAAIIAVIKKDK